MSEANAVGNDPNKAAGANISGNNEKTSYETPVIIPLGELVRGYGQACSAGTNPGTGGGGDHCAPGGTAAGQCRVGSNPTKKCKAGGIK